MTPFTIYAPDREQLRALLVRIAPHLVDCPVYWDAGSALYFATFTLADT